MPARTQKPKPTPKAPIKVSELKEIADQKDLQALLVLTVGRDGTVSVVTYGENKKKCQIIGEYGQGLWGNAISIVPFRTVFGWGNNGTPTHTLPKDYVYTREDARKLLESL